MVSEWLSGIAKLLKLAAENERLGDVVKCLACAARADHHNAAVAEETGENALIHIHGLDLREIHLKSAPRDETDLDDHTLIRDGILTGGVAYEGL